MKPLLCFSYRLCFRAGFSSALFVFAFVANTFADWRNQTGNRSVQELELTDFVDTTERDIAHLQYTRSFPEGAGSITLVASNHERRPQVLSYLRKRSQGPHDLMLGQAGAEAVCSLRELEFLVVADDEAELQAMQDEGNAQ